MLTSSSKIRPIDELAESLREARAEGRRVVLCHGVFDLLHPGHVQHFQEAARLGDILVATVTADEFVNKGPGRPAFSHRLRMESLAALEPINFVGLSEAPTAVDIIRRLKPDVYVKGTEYADSSNDLTGEIDNEVAAVKEGGGTVHYTNGEVFSSSALINRYFNTLTPQGEAYLREFRMRHSADEVVSALKGVQDLRVLVVGDIIIDQYCYCSALAKSPREKIVAAQYVSEEQFAGGSLAIANHLAGICKEVTLIGTIGPEDHLLEFCKAHLRPNVELIALRTPNRPTVIKRRFLDSTYLGKMFEIQYLDDSPHDDNTDTELARALHRDLRTHDLVVVADFGHGVLTENARDIICASPTFMAVNTQANSANFGFNTLERYRRVDYACLHEMELRLSAHSQHGPLPALARKMRLQLGATRFMVTRGPNGTLLIETDGSEHTTPVMTQRIVDRVGAGDTVFSVTSPLVFKQCPADVLGFVGNCAGAIAVQTVCNRDPVSQSSLSKFIVHLLK